MAQNHQAALGIEAQVHRTLGIQAQATAVGQGEVLTLAAPGVQANMAANGGVFTLQQADRQGISGYNSGNPDLKAEKGRSTTVGLVLTPRSIPAPRTT